MIHTSSPLPENEPGAAQTHAAKTDLPRWLQKPDGSLNLSLTVVIGVFLGVVIFGCGALALGAFYLVTTPGAFSLPLAAWSTSAPSATVLPGATVVPSSPDTAATAAAPQLAALPTRPCAGAGFTLDGASFRLETAALGSPLTLPAEPDAARFLEEAGGRRLILLAPGALPPAGAAQATLSDERCNKTLYQLYPPQAGRLEDLAQFAPAAELAIFAAQDADGNGWLIQGTLMEQEVIAAGSTPMPGEALVEVGLLAVEQAGGMVQVRLSLYNFGTEPLTVSADNLALTAEGAPPQSPQRTQPALPLQIAPGEIIELSLSFPAPAQGWGVLRVFSVEYELADFVE